ncbi:MAG: hypothetical protein M1831_005902 [Alyxoria varia]|nr:MAG: hypothetical protein M1831_005902 [Alyxoria varia]
MEARSKLPVHLPHPNPTVSYWQNPPNPIADLRSTGSLPPNAVYVVVGSGISGAFLAFNILKKRPQAKVVMLEARRACSGATGRNGGHTKGASYRSFLNHKQEHGLEEAVRIAKLERQNVLASQAFAREHGIDCDMHRSETVDVIFDQEQWESGKLAVDYMNKTIPHDTEKYQILGAEDAKRKSLCPNALGAFVYEAGSVSAYKFAIGIIKLALERGLNLQTNTPVTHISKGSSNGWRLETLRGAISTKNVVLATNGYTAHLLSAFRGVIVPLRGQITAQRPGSHLPSPLPLTYTFAYSNGYEYMIPRPKGTKYEGDIVMGGGWANLPGEGVSEFGETDDSVLAPAVSRYLFDSTKRYFGDENWGEDHPDGRVRTEWTGIMGNSADGLPYVGEMPGEKGLWASVSFNGHGMVICMKCAEALTSMMLDEQPDLDWFPHSFLLTEQRLKKPFDGQRNQKPPAEMLEQKSNL